MPLLDREGSEEIVRKKHFGKEIKHFKVFKPIVSFLEDLRQESKIQDLKLIVFSSRGLSII